MLDTPKRLIRELRKWNLAPLGAVLVVVLLMAAAFGFVATARDEKPDRQKMIRTYFATKPGNRMPHDQLRLVFVSRCDPPNGWDFEYRGRPIYVCSLSFKEQAFRACFTFDQHGVVAGSVELAKPGSGCDPVSWDERAKSLVVL